MEIILTDNIILSACIALGGLAMKSRADSSERNIGFRTKRSLASGEAWRLANSACGIRWLILGIVSLVLTLVSVFIITPKISASAALAVQAAILVLNISLSAAAVISVQHRLAIRQGEGSERKNP